MTIDAVLWKKFIKPDTDVTFNSCPGEWFWLTVGILSFRIKHEDEGVVIDVYAVGHEDEEQLHSCWFEFNDAFQIIYGE